MALNGQIEHAENCFWTKMIWQHSNTKFRRKAMKKIFLALLIILFVFACSSTNMNKSNAPGYRPVSAGSVRWADDPIAAGGRLKWAEFLDQFLKRWFWGKGIKMQLKNSRAGGSYVACSFFQWYWLPSKVYKQRLQPRIIFHCFKEVHTLDPGSRMMSLWNINILLSREPLN